MAKELILTVNYSIGKKGIPVITVDLPPEDGRDRTIGWANIEEGKIVMRMGECVNNHVDEFIENKLGKEKKWHHRLFRKG